MFSFFSSKFSSLTKALKKAPLAIGFKIQKLFSQNQRDASLEAFEELLYEADLGVSTSLLIVDKIKTFLRKNPEASSDEILKKIEEELLLLLEVKEREKISGLPHVILFVGVNGSGKTTSLAKLAKIYRDQGKKVEIIAADTFRAAAVDQLDRFAKKLGVDIIKSQEGSDPASVVFDGLQAAKSRGVDIVLIDSAGRLQSKISLMKELEKICRICGKVVDKAPHEILLVLDATTGQNALDQAKTFHAFSPITGIILTKLEGSAKGGIVVSIAHRLALPIQWVGVGETDDSLLAFDKEAFIKALLS